MTSEISEHMTKNDARLITGYIRNLIASVTEKIDEIGKMLTKAYDRRAWVALGYESWDAYVSAELRTDRLRLDRDDRQDLVVQLRSAGMTTRAIGAAVGTSDHTVRQDLKSGARNHAPESVTGTDGKTYPSSPPVRDEPLLDGEDERRTVPAGSDTPRARDDLPAGDPPPVEEGPSPAPSVTPSPEALARHERERAAQVSRQTATDNLAKSVWLIAGQAEMDEPVDRIISDWLPEHDIYPKPTTAERLKTAADYLFALSERWPW